MSKEQQISGGIVSKRFRRTPKAEYWYNRISELKPRLPKPLAPWWRTPLVAHPFESSNLQYRIEAVLYKYAQDAPIVEYLESIAEAYEKTIHPTQ